MPTLHKIELDARELEHPIPLERAMKALHELDETNYFYMIHRKNPIPLIDLAAEQHFQTLSQEDSQGDWHILITKNSDTNLSELVRV